MAFEKRIVHTFHVLAAVGIILFEGIIRDGIGNLFTAAYNHAGSVVWVWRWLELIQRGLVQCFSVGTLLALSLLSVLVIIAFVVRSHLLVYIGREHEVGTSSRLLRCVSFLCLFRRSLWSELQVILMRGTGVASFLSCVCDVLWAEDVVSIATGGTSWASKLFGTVASSLHWRQAKQRIAGIRTLKQRVDFSSGWHPWLPAFLTTYVLGLFQEILSSIGVITGCLQHSLLHKSDGLACNVWLGLL